MTGHERLTEPAAGTQPGMPFVPVLVFLAAAAFLLQATVLLAVPLPDLLGFLGLAAGLVATLHLGARHAPVAAVLLVAFAARAAAALVHAYALPLPDSQGDAVGFESMAYGWSLHGLDGVFGQFSTGAHFYTWLIGLVYALTERSPLLIQSANVLLGTLVVWNVYRVAAVLWGIASARRAAWAAALFPSLILYSAIPLREAAFVYLLTVAALATVRWVRAPTAPRFVLAMLAAAAATLFHTAAVLALLVLAALVLVRLARSLRSGDAAGLAHHAVGAALVAGCVAAMVATGAGLEKIGSLDALTADNVGALQAVRATSRAAYLEDLTVTHPLDLLWQAPLRAVYLLFTPFPWMVTAAADVVGIADAALYAALALLVFRSWTLVRRNPAAMVILVMALVLLVALGLGTSNYGTALRHRAKLVPLLLMVIPLLPGSLSLTRARGAPAPTPPGEGRLRPGPARAAADRDHAPRPGGEHPEAGRGALAPPRITNGPAPGTRLFLARDDRGATEGASIEGPHPGASAGGNT